MEHYDAERIREQREVVEQPADEEEEVVEIMAPYGVTREDMEPLLDRFKNNTENWVDFMMKFELNLERPDVSRAWVRFSVLFSSLQKTNRCIDFSIDHWSILSRIRPYSTCAVHDSV